MLLSKLVVHLFPGEYILNIYHQNKQKLLTYNCDYPEIILIT